MVKQILIGVFCAVIFSVALAATGLFNVHIIAYALAAWTVLCLFLKRNYALYITGSVAVILCLAWVGVTVSGVAEKNAVTPEEYLTEYNPKLAFYTFTPNRHVVMQQQGGVLARIDSSVEPVEREIVFSTDKNGLRNTDGADSPEVLLIGGAFVAGSGNTQSSLLSEQLKANYNIAAYNVATCGSLDEQALLALTLVQEQPLVKKGILFVFEGDDFEPFTTEVHYPFKRAVNFLGNNELARFLREYSNRFAPTKVEQAGVTTFTLGTKELAFSEAYVEEATAAEYTVDPKFEELLASLSDSAKLVQAVVFIPTKYRVYAPLLDGKAPVLPESPKLDALRSMAAKHSFAVYDLTPHLQAKAIAQWGEKKELLWWPDDVYWNESGSEVAAELVKEIVRGNL